LCLLEKEKWQDDNNANEFDEKMQKRSPKSFETMKESRAKKSKEKGQKKKREKKGNRSR